MGYRILVWTTAAVLATTFCAQAQARDILVPQEVRTLRKAVRQAQFGDRILVTGGKHRGSLKIKERGITLSGSDGATILRTRMTVLADDVTIEGFDFKLSALVLRGNDAIVRDNRWNFAHRRKRIAIMVEGERARILYNDLVTPGRRVREAIRVEAPDVTISGNRIESSRRVLVDGARATITENDFFLLDEGEREFKSVHVRGADAVVADNRIRSDDGGIVIEGDRAQVLDNDVGLFDDGNRLMHSIDIQGIEAVVAHNAVASINIAIELDGDRSQVLDNEILAGPISLRGDDLVCRGNSILARSKIVIGGNRALVEDNEVITSTNAFHDHALMSLFGDDAVVRGNLFQNREDTAQRNGVRVRGERLLYQNNELQHTGRIGLDVEGSDARIIDSTGRGRRRLIAVTGERTTVSGCTFPDLPTDPIVLIGDDASVTDCRIDFSLFGIHVTGSGATVSDNDVSAENLCIEVEGDGALVYSNTLTGNQVGIEVMGANAQLRSNTATDLTAAMNTSATAAAFRVTGDGATLTENLATGCGSGIEVFGGSFLVSNNEILESGVTRTEELENTRGIAVETGLLGGTISNNQVSHHAGQGIRIVGNQVTLTDNMIETLTSGALEAMYVEGDTNSLARQTLTSVAGRGGVLVRGDSNVLDGVSVQIRGAGVLGIQLVGTSNEARDCVVESVTGNGFDLDGDAAVMTGCTARACGAAEIVNRGTNASVQDSAFVDSGDVDVRALTPFGTFLDNVFGTFSEE